MFRDGGGLTIFATPYAECKRERLFARALQIYILRSPPRPKPVNDPSSVVR